VNHDDEPGLISCDDARELISACLDGEATADEAGVVDRHLAGCADCAQWREVAHEVTRRVRLTAAPSTPPRARDLTAVRPARKRSWRGSVALPRAGLLLVACAQMAISVPIILLGHDHDAPLHVAHEEGSFDVALAVGFVLAAWRPSRAVGMRALVGAATLLLLVTAGLDLVNGRTTVADEAPHLLALAGWLLLCRLAHVDRRPGEAPGRLRRTLLGVARAKRSVPHEAPDDVDLPAGVAGGAPEPAVATDRGRAAAAASGG
jgi:predicted anti-sigma-YlaC factor YlaD